MEECLDGFGEGFVGHFVEVGDGDAGGEDGAVGVLGGEGCGGLGCEFVEFDSGDAGVDSLDYLLGNYHRVHKLLIQVVRWRLILGWRLRLEIGVICDIVCS